MMILETDPKKLRESRIEQLVEFALKSLHERGLPPFIPSFVEFVTKEAKTRFKVARWTAEDYGETAALAALRAFYQEIA